MNAVISGQAETAFVLDGDRAWTINFYEPDTDVPRAPAEFSRLFSDVDDMQFIEDMNRDEIAQRLEVAVDDAAALYLALMLFDAQTDEDIRVEAAQELEKLLERKETKAYVENVLYARPLPKTADREGAFRCCNQIEAPALSEFLGRLEHLQPVIEEIRTAWERIPANLFESEDEHAHCRATFIRQGFFRYLVQTKTLRESIDQFRLDSQLNAGVSGIRNHAKILAHWVAPFNEPRERPYHVEGEGDGRWETVSAGEESSRRDHVKGIDRLGILDKVQTQKGAILNAMGLRQLRRAREYIFTLVKYPLELGGAEYAAKTLCDLARNAKQLSMFSFQLELAKQSTELMEEDPQTWNHYADALLQLNRLPEALTAYQSTMRDHPDNVVSRNGCACVLALFARLDEALAMLPDVLPVTREGWIGYHIRGMILLRQNRFKVAVQVFKDGVRENPIPDDADYFRTALVIAHIKQKQYKAAAEELDKVSSARMQLPANILRFHVLGASVVRTPEVSTKVFPAIFRQGLPSCAMSWQGGL